VDGEHLTTWHPTLDSLTDQAVQPQPEMSEKFDRGSRDFSDFHVERTLSFELFMP
jgi:hypothetical protein